MGVFQCTREFVRITGVTILATILAMVIAVILTRISAVLLQFDIGWRLHVTAIGVAGICGPIIVIPLLRANSRLAAMKRELEQLARTDTLTGLPNRRAYFEAADRIFAAAGKSGAPVAVMMIDIDHFKLINDRYGHDTGDGVLKAVAAAIAWSVASCGTAGALAARIGGEEFAVAVGGLDSGGAAALAGRLCADVRQVDYEFQDTSIGATVSVGVAMRAGAESVDAVLKAADNAVYEAKRSGRDRWCMTKGEVPAAGKSEDIRFREGPLAA